MSGILQIADAPALVADGVGRRFGGTWAVCEVSFALAAGEAVLVAGRNGSGKSTLLRLLAGALRADRGQIRVEGHGSRAELRARTALLAHDTFAYEPLTALENLELFARVLRRPAGRKSLVARLVEVGLESSADAQVRTFSAGMHQRLALARLLLQEPTVALLDEPHAALDALGMRQVDELVLGLKRRGAAVVLATHDVRRTAALCERGIILERGRIQWTGPARTIPGGGVTSSLLEEAV